MQWHLPSVPCSILKMYKYGIQNSPARTQISAMAYLIPFFDSGLIVACAAMKRSNPITTTVKMEAATENPTAKYVILQVSCPTMPEIQSRPTVKNDINTREADEAFMISAIAMLIIKKLKGNFRLDSLSPYTTRIKRELPKREEKSTKANPMITRVLVVLLALSIAHLVCNLPVIFVAESFVAFISTCIR